MVIFLVKTCIYCSVDSKLELESTCCVCTVSLCCRHITMLQVLFLLMKLTPWAVNEGVKVSMRPAVGSSLSYWSKWMVC